MVEKNCLIISYSYSGHTHRIAAALRELCGGVAQEIYPSQPYPMSFEPLLAQVEREVREGYLPPLLPLTESAADYEVIFVGSPNWCGTIAPPLASWLARNELSGKLIAPFYSYCGGSAGDIRRAIQTLCPEATVAPPLPLQDSGGEGLKATLTKWLQDLGVDQ